MGQAARIRPTTGLGFAPERASRVEHLVDFIEACLADEQLDRVSPRVCRRTHNGKPDFDPRYYRYVIDERGRASLQPDRP